MPEVLKLLAMLQIQITESVFGIQIIKQIQTQFGLEKKGNGRVEIEQSSGGRRLAVEKKNDLW